MLSEDSFTTIASLSKGIYREKGSRFIALAYPVNSGEEVKEKLAEWRKEFHDAHHHCFAYCLGKDQQNYRMNDDGEPSGSAGRPIYGQILSYGLTNILIVVVRYYGGTKLGIPGLINAYRTAAKDALSQASIVVKTLRVLFEIGFEYAAMNEVMRTLKEENATILSQTFDNHCMLTFSIRKNLSGKILSRLEKVRGLTIQQGELMNSG